METKRGREGSTDGAWEGPRALAGGRSLEGAKRLPADEAWEGRRAHRQAQPGRGGALSGERRRRGGWRTQRTVEVWRGGELVGKQSLGGAPHWPTNGGVEVRRARRRTEARRERRARQQVTT
jgi:hypothetical protein